MNKSSEKRPNPPRREENPGSRAALFAGASIIVSLIFTVYGAMALVTDETNTWLKALALITTIYGLYSLAIVAYAYKKRGRKPVVAIQFGAASFLIAYVFIVTMNSLIISGVGTSIFIAAGLWCNWIAVIKIVKQQASPATEKR